MVRHCVHFWHCTTIFSKLFGLYPLQNFKFNVSVLWCIYSLLVLLPCFSVAKFQPPKLSRIGLFLLPLNYLITCICCLLSSIKLLLMRRKLQLFLTILEKTETSLNNYGADLNYSLKIVITATFRLLLPLIPFLIWFYKRSLSINPRMFFFWFTYTQINIVCFHFIVLSSFLRAQFHYINKILNERNCHQMIVFHDRLINSCSLLNELFSHQLLFIVLHLVVSLIDNFSTTVTHLQKIFLDKVQVNYMAVSLFIFYDCYCLLNFVAIIDNCTSVSKKANSFNKKLFKLLLETTKKDLIEDDLLHIQLRRNRKVEFTACGLFPLNYTSFHSAITTCFTYLILINQLKDY